MKLHNFLLDQEKREIANYETILSQALDSCQEQLIHFALRAVYPLYLEAIEWSEGRISIDRELQTAYEAIETPNSEEPL